MRGPRRAAQALRGTGGGHARGGAGVGARYRWLRAGDLNAFFGLALDNLSNLVILWGILVGLFHFPPDLVLQRMIPGTAVGVDVQRLLREQSIVILGLLLSET